MSRPAVLAGLVLLVPWAAVSAQTTQTTQMTVAAVIQTSCDVSGSPSGVMASGTLNFGTWPAVGETVRAASSDLYVRCNSPAPSVQITLNTGANANGNQRQLGGPAGARIAYDLFRDSARSQPWAPGTAYSFPVSSSNPVLIPVYGTTVVPLSTADGSYSDIVSVTVDY